MKPKIDWTRARSLLAVSRSHARRRLAAGILFGKTLFEIKLQAGICGAGGDRRSKVQVGPLKSDERAWNVLCKKELGISRQTANRYIARYVKAADFAKSLPEAGEILFSDSASLSDKEIETLAGFVEKLVDQMTKSALEIELGLTVEVADEDEDPGSEESGDQELKIDLPKEAQVFFSSITRQIADFKKKVCGSREYRNYKTFLEHLPLDDGRDGMPSLTGIKEGLEDAIKQGLSSILDDLEETITGKLHGKPTKRGRKNSLTHSRK